MSFVVINLFDLFNNCNHTNGNTFFFVKFVLSRIIIIIKVTYSCGFQEMYKLRDELIIYIFSEPDQYIFDYPSYEINSD